MTRVILTFMITFAAVSCSRQPSSPCDRMTPPREANCKCKPDCTHRNEHCGCTHQCGCRHGK